MVKEIEQCHEKGQPVLVGTVSIDKSELIARMLAAKGVKHKVLNAKYHELEATIISQAGRYKAVTIATNMAGRGTDIMLGGNAEFMARTLANEKVREAEKNKEEAPSHEILMDQFLKQLREQVKKEREQVTALGGLHIMGTERHESRRIDNQLRGRSGRQGDPGSSRFYVSLEDDLMRLFAGDRIKVMMDRFGFEEGQVLESGMVSGAIEIAQKRVEGFNFEIRKQLLEYDSTMNKQREVIYGLRRSIIEGEDTRELIQESILSTVEDAVHRFCPQDHAAKDRDVDGMVVYFLDKFNFDISVLKDRIPETATEELVSMIYARLKEIYTEKESKFGVEQIRRLERMFLLHTIDHKWKEHLYAMDRMKEGMGLRALGQRDPLVEYKREGYHMFQAMYETIHVDVAEMIFKLQPMEEDHRAQNVYGSRQELVHQEFSGIQGTLRMPQAEGQEPPFSGAGPSASQIAGAVSMPSMPVPPQRRPAASQPGSSEKVGRNDNCPCGSGKKYKKCCGQ